MKIYIGADHRGYRLKEVLKRYLTRLGYIVNDLGNTRYNPSDDYPDFGKKVALEVKKNSSSRGIVICGSGVGICIAANRMKGVRAVHTDDNTVAKASRHDDDTNVLCLGADFVSAAKARGIVLAWLKARFSGVKRHQKRIMKLDYIN